MKRIQASLANQHSRIGADAFADMDIALLMVEKNNKTT